MSRTRKVTLNVSSLINPLSLKAFSVPTLMYRLKLSLHLELSRHIKIRASLRDNVSQTGTAILNYSIFDLSPFFENLVQTISCVPLGRMSWNSRVDAVYGGGKLRKRKVILADLVFWDNSKTKLAGKTSLLLVRLSPFVWNILCVVLSMLWHYFIGGSFARWQIRLQPHFLNYLHWS